MFFNQTATTEIYTLSLHDALPIYERQHPRRPRHRRQDRVGPAAALRRPRDGAGVDRRDLRRQAQGEPDESRRRRARSEEHTSELQSRQYLVCRLLLEKKNTSGSVL